MSNGSNRGAAGDELWVVDVTAPLATGRVREVAADAAARLKLPVEKLIVLLENRIGPVTKPLPHASAARVAEVLHLSGAEVQLRPADRDDAAEQGEAPKPGAAESDEEERTASEPASRAVSAATPDADTHPGAPERPEIADAPEELDGPTGEGPPEATIGRASRGRPTGTEASHERRPEASRSADDPWGRLSGDEPDDEAMLAGWKHTPEPTARPAEPRPADPGPVDAADAVERAAAGPPPAASPSSSTSPTRRPPVASEDDDRIPIAQRLPARDEPHEEPSSWSYGLRDPFAEAEARERTLRRWVLMIALLVASTIFVILQWAYSRPDLDGRGPAGFDHGLVAYRDGAFVSAARAWTPLAEDGDPKAMYMLGWMAEFGQGRPWSNREAASWYRQAAERGHAPSQLRLADLHLRGLGVDYDLEAALDWYLEAAQAGIPRAQREAALVLARLDRVDDARVWLARAASRDPDAAAWWKLVNDPRDATNVSP